MILPTAAIQRRLGSGRTACRGFTLIELLAVMTIILILAGLILNLAGNAQYKAATSRAASEIKQMEVALESYKVDNGAYPRPSTAGTGSDGLNAQASSDPTAGTAPSYITTSQFLFQQLSGATTATPTNKSYLSFLPSQLANSDGSSLGTTPTLYTYIVDPFGFSYGYSTANLYAQDTNNATPPGNADLSKAGYNPTFDLWSTAGYTTATGTGQGKTYPASMTATQYNTLWVKNW